MQASLLLWSLLCRSMADHDFAGDFAARVMAQAGFGVFERKHAVDDRPDLMLFHHAAQVFEITTAAGRNRLVCRLAQEHGHEVDADRDYFARAIRERHTTGRDRHRKLAIDNHQVADVERARPYTAEHLAHGW